MYKLFTLTSDLHSELTIAAAREKFIKDIEQELGEEFVCCNGDFSTYGEKEAEEFIYVRTGGTEGIFRSIFCAADGSLKIPGGRPVRIITSGQSNSLAASMEILSFLNQRQYPAEILHGSSKAIVEKMRSGYSEGGQFHVQPYTFGKVLEGERVGVVGRPSDWLISSDVDYAVAKEKLGVEIIDIPISELEEIVTVAEPVEAPGLKELNAPRYGKSLTSEDMKGALSIYAALEVIIAKYSLSGVTIRCFDLLTSLRNTGCMALAILNSKGITATCEGDVPTLLSMCIAKKLWGTPGFQANLSKIDSGKLLFAHCTVPLNIVDNYCYDTHFESGIGVAVHGEFKPGKARIFKISPDCSEMFHEQVEIEANQYENNLCRTQIIVRGEGLQDYFLRSSIGNHHVIVPEL